MDENPEVPNDPRISRRQLLTYAGAGATLIAAGPLLGPPASALSLQAAAREEQRRRGRPGGREWRAGDHHIHV
ncbi:MAG: twin-arginine translocation signal domain-containing protein [Acidimicrobiales bacterium]